MILISVPIEVNTAQAVVEGFALSGSFFRILLVPVYHNEGLHSRENLISLTSVRHAQLCKYSQELSWENFRTEFLEEIKLS